ncbi:hypothetical protein DERP_010734 [Dermatophagoides pteronyssinus]|uniref:Uncharacterized protein n=1 Tax=Dermatophagoides pteronyssinus TaxID=6956 RepID=A0ABQ8J751_DERPT|nr:hypothetical protein DERP_010734 [Dermatophagoides pteronyssinus]
MTLLVLNQSIAIDRIVWFSGSFWHHHRIGYDMPEILSYSVVIDSSDFISKSSSCFPIDDNYYYYYY